MTCSKPQLGFADRGEIVCRDLDAAHGVGDLRALVVACRGAEQFCRLCSKPDQFGETDKVPIAQHAEPPSIPEISGSSGAPASIDIAAQSFLGEWRVPAQGNTLPDLQEIIAKSAERIARARELANELRNDQRLHRIAMQTVFVLEDCYESLLNLQFESDEAKRHSGSA